jgi:replicative DNA helicase
VTLTDALEAKKLLEKCGGYDYITGISMFLPSIANVAEYVRIVKEKALLREMSRVCVGANAQINERESDPESVVADIMAKLANVIRRTAKSGHTITSADVMEIGQGLLDKKVDGTKTRFPALDGLTGGLAPGTMTVLAARPGMGKSALYQSMARNIMQAEGAVAIFSLEMTRQQVVARLASMESKVPLSKILQRAEPTQDEVDKAMSGMAGIAEGWRGFYFDDNPYASPDYIRAKLGEIRRRTPIDLVVVDYLQLMRYPGKEKSLYEKVTDLSRSMKLMAMEFNVPVLLLSQLNRDVEKRGDGRPRLSDLRDSGAIEQDADMVWFLYREGLDKANHPDEDADLIVAKNRQGECGLVHLHWDGAHTLFTEQSPRVPPVGR